MSHGSDRVSIVATRSNLNSGAEVRSLKQGGLQRSPTVSCLCLCRRQDPGRPAEVVVSVCVPVFAHLETAASPQQASPACLLVLPALAVELCAGLFADRVPERESPSPEHAS